MKLFNHVIEVDFRALRPWSHFRVHRRELHKHLVWGKISVLWGQPHLVEVEVHKGCGGLVRGLGDDYISYCEECEVIVEGDTEHITTEEWEAQQ